MVLKFLTGASYQKYYKSVLKILLSFSNLFASIPPSDENYLLNLQNFNLINENYCKYLG